MKTKKVCAASAWLFVLVVLCHRAAAQNTAFTYQGRLTANGAPQAGSSDLTFTLYDAASGGNVIGGPLTNSAASDANGVFTVTLDFGSTPFEGQPRWLQIGVRPNGGGAFTTLTPRQPLTANPYALYAATPTVQGQPGAPGSVWREASGAPINSTGVDGDYFLDGSTANVYLRSSGSYAVVANIKGAQGQPGMNGLNGQNGLPGAPGSVWREASSAPINSTGVDGDYFLDGSTANVYLRSSGSYAVVANIKGAQACPAPPVRCGARLRVLPSIRRVSTGTTTSTARLETFICGLLAAMRWSPTSRARKAPPVWPCRSTASAPRTSLYSRSITRAAAMAYPA